MKESRLERVKNSLYELSKTNPNITLQQLKEHSEVNNPEHELEILEKKGIIIQVKRDEFRWV